MQVYVSHLQHVIENSFFCTIYKASVSPGFAEQMKPILHILCYNGSLVTWTIVSLTIAKFKLLIFSMFGFALLCTANMFMLMILCVLCYVMLRPTASRPVWVSSTHLGLTTRFLFLSDICGFVDVGCSLWQENRSVVYNCCWSSPAQSFLAPSPVGLVTIFYCLRFETSSTWRVRSPYLYPSGTGWPSYTPACSELFPSNDCCTVACLHSCYLVVGVHFPVCYGGQWKAWPFYFLSSLC
jgi:hypothetical protein